MSPTRCDITDRAFTRNEARNEARRYRQRGPAGQTREILNSIRSLGLMDAKLLGIGGGIGAIHDELLPEVARSATHADASSAHLEEARAKTARRGQGDRVESLHADFTEAASELAEADIVTLDRIVCCYPGARALLAAAARRRRRGLGMSHAWATSYNRLGSKVIIAIQRLRRDPFRTSRDPVNEIERVLTGEGSHRKSIKRLFVWETALGRR